jgi:hypothetical protein
MNERIHSALNYLTPVEFEVEHDYSNHLLLNA